MKIKVLPVVIILILSFVACNSAKTEDVKILSVTIEPQKYFLEQLVGDKFKVNCVVPKGSNPESFDLAPSQMISISKSAAYFKVGLLGIENTWIKNIGEANPNIRFIDCSEGINPILEHECHHEGHDHSHHHGHAGGVDPHTWSSPASAKMMVENMYKAVLAIDSLNESYYKENYIKVINEINTTDSIIRQYIDNAPAKSFIIFHPALSYFSQEYGLEQLTIEYEGKNPSPSQLKQLVDKAKSDGVKAVFIQQEFDPKNTETVANEIGVKPIPINLLSYNWSDEMIKVAKAIAGENE
jgi:zinc transport system substrate-binding protein